jgi:hypothetical protein
MLCALKVEMAGIEPASERLDPRMSTSVAGRFCRQMGPRPAKAPLNQPLEPESSSFMRLAAFRMALPLCVARSFPGERAVQTDVALL